LSLPEAEVEIKPAEKEMAWQLIDAMTGEFDAAAHRDEYREALLGIIEAKASGAEITAPAAAPAAPVSDLMATLQASITAAKAARSAPAPQTIAEAKAAAGARPARKSALVPAAAPLAAKEEVEEPVPARRRKSA
jgi:DNA end-binding protein Ku